MTTTADPRPTIQPDYRPASWATTLPEFLAVAANLTESGYDVGPEVEKVEALQRAAQEAISEADHLPNDLLAMDPADVAHQFRQVAVNRATQISLAGSLHGFENRLSRAAAASLVARSDTLVKAMRKPFDQNLKAVATAHRVGLTPDVDGATLADTGTSEQIAAYRVLPAAVAELDRIAGLRGQLTTVVGVGPNEHPVAAFLTNVPDLLHLESAENIWRGQQRWEQWTGPMAGAHMQQVPAKRLGGPWLALICGGYTIRLNTGSEAHAVLAAAREG